MSVVTLSTGDTCVRFDGAQSEQSWVLRSLDGWLNSTDSKLEVDERASGDGAHDINPATITYSARTVTIGYRLLPQDMYSRQALLDMQNQIRCLLHHSVKIRVQDGVMDTQAIGYVSMIEVSETSQNLNRQYLSGQIVLVCARPEIVSTTPQIMQLRRNTDLNGDGLCYSTGLRTWWEGEPNNSISVLETDVLSGYEGLQYPLRYTYEEDITYLNTCTLSNHGSSPSYPVFECYGNFPRGVVLEFPELDTRLSANINVGGAPLILDSRSRTATIGGIDVSYALTSRGFPIVKPHSDLAVLLITQTDGYVQVTNHDTYM